VVGEGGNDNEDSGNLDGRPGKEARTADEQEALDVGLEGTHEVVVRHGGRVGTTDGGQRLHDEHVAEEERDREGRGEGQQRQEEALVPGQEGEAVAQEGKEAQWRLRTGAHHGWDLSDRFLAWRREKERLALVVDVGFISSGFLLFFHLHGSSFSSGGTWFYRFRDATTAQPWDNDKKHHLFSSSGTWFYSVYSVWRELRNNLQLQRQLQREKYRHDTTQLSIITLRLLS
jgi:hypothetical protein